MDNKWLKNIPQEVGWYLAGFTDGEGSFNVSLKKVSDYQLGWKLDPSFNVSQKDISNLILFKKVLGTGTLRKRKDGIIYFEIRNYEMLFQRVLPFFEKFNFRSQSKVRNFSIFKKIIEAINKKEHLTKEGFEKILQLREKLNEGKGRKRKYSMDDYNSSQSESSETIRQTP